MDDSDIQRLIKDDRDRGIEALIAAHSSFVRNALRAIYGGKFDDHVIESATNLAALHVADSIGRFDPRIGRLRSWYLKAAMWAVSKDVKAIRGMTTSDQLDQIAAPVAVEGRITVEQIDRLIESLSPTEQTVIRSYRDSILSGQRISQKLLAAELGMTVDCFYKHLSNARKALRSLDLRNAEA
ncbi:sigma-70 family RNA polymerase sigma factor [Botrimarina mediterranea]|uniref:sigma-70 family RNA polymerase sigma factor n=1 Tax=Botrimarina mediterranea TaxID=2528022 RepID=UPI0011A86AEC